MSKRLLKKIVCGILFSAIGITASAQSVSVNVNSATHINLQGFFGSDIATGDTALVTVTVMDGGNAVPTSRLTGSVFLNIFNATGPTNNSNTIYSGNLALGDVESTSTDPTTGVTTYIWNVDNIAPRTSPAPAVSTGVRPQVRAFSASGLVASGNLNSGVTLPTIDVVDNTALSTSDFNKSEITSFYPNPASSVIIIGEDVVTETYTVINLSGAVVKEVPANGELVVSDLTNGVYFLVTDSGIAKFIKE